MALRLLSIHGDIVRVKGKGWLTPLHCAAEQGNVELLLMFLSVCPKSMEDVTIRNETCLHLALKSHQLEAFKVLIGWIELGCEDGPFWEEGIRNWKDDQGNTILDLATSSQQELSQVVSLLAQSRHDKDVDVTPAQLSKDSKHPIISTLNEYTHLLRTDKRLNKAAYDGNTKELYAILREDQTILDRIDQAPFVDTPLHIAAYVGHTMFAKELMMLKPSFAKKLNQDRFSPLHLAVKKKNFETAHELVAMDKELVSVRGKHGLTPFHYAVKIGNDEVAAFLVACPESFEDLTVRKNALHLAVKQLVAEFLVACPESFQDLTVRNENALHLAVKHRNLAALKVLYRWQVLSGLRGKPLTLRDHNDITPLDIAESQPDNEIRQFLKADLRSRKLWRKCEQIISFFQKSETNTPHHLSCVVRRLLKPSLVDIILARFGRQYWLQAHEGREILLVVCTLIATATYQAVLSPPGGVWQGDPSLLSSDSKERDQLILNKVGKTVLSDSAWIIFAILNTVAFATSVAQIIIVNWSRPSSLFTVAFCWIFCYAMALHVISSGSIIPVVVSSLALCFLMKMFVEMPPDHRLLMSNKIKCWISTGLICFLFYVLYVLGVF